MLTSRVTSIFDRDLLRSMGDKFEARAGQKSMAQAVARAIEGSGILVVEAETGIGKSLAYLIPALEHYRRTGVRAVISTHTRNLQRQLAEKDFRIARNIVGGDISGAVLVGRNNYACKRAVHRVITRDKRDLDRGAWLNSLLLHETGDLESVADASVHLDAVLRREISAPNLESVCRGCATRDQCFMIRARKQAVAADIVFVNHSLLFSDIQANNALLGPYGVLVIDESHHLEDAATSFFSLSYSPRTIRGSWDSIYSPDHEEILLSARSVLDFQQAREVEDIWARFHTAMAEADRASKSLFERLEENARRSPTAARGDMTRRIMYAEGAPMFYATEDACAAVRTSLATMAATSAELESVLGEEERLAETASVATLGEIARATRETMDEFDFLASGTGDDHVFFAEINRSRGVSGLMAAPVDVSAQLGAIIEDSSDAAVLTSATLSVAGDFEFTLNRLGISSSPRLAVERFDSPFDGTRRRVLVASHLPDPGAVSFNGAAAELIRSVHDSTQRRMVVLCTSRVQLDQIERMLARNGGSAKSLYAQVDGVARGDLLNRYIGDSRGILLGLASFWEGVDLPGDHVEIVVIVKMPFLVPDDPVVQARSHRLSSNGDNPFEKLFIPDVVLRLRQGMGRLIRTSSDRGAVILLDRRLHESAYGAVVMDGVAPNGFDLVNSNEAMIERVTSAFIDD